MKRNFLKIYAIASCLLVSTSCSNLLDITETDFLGGDIALRTVSNNESLLMGAYASYDADMAVRLNGVFSDELKAGDFYNAQTTHEWQYAADDIGIRDSYTAVDPLYRVIDRVNRIFVALPNAISESAGDDAKKSIIRGEALFLRAFAHFELFRYYCENYDPSGLGMIYMTEPSLEPKARENMDTYFQKLKADLDEAKSLLTTTPSDLFRANRLAVIGLQARVALYTRNWKDAITYSTEYINAKPLASKSEFAGIWTDANNTEVGFKISKTVSNSRLGSIYRGLFTSVNGVLQAPSVSWVPSSKLWDMFDQSNDVRFSSYLIDEPILAAVQGKPSKIVKKYAGGAYASTNENVNHFKVFRTGEMYLIRAEALAEDGAISGANSAESDLNILRNARIVDYTNQTFTSKDAIISAIMDERFKELAFEGHRFWDLKRRGLPVQRLVGDAPTAATATLPANDFRFVLPIPNEERLANPLIQQNKGYE